MAVFRHMLRRSISMWSAVCILAAQPALAQLETKVIPTLPSLGQDDVQDPGPITCRPPQLQTDSRLLGPKVCKPQREWDRLHAQGLDISADGKSVVASEKFRSLHSSTCRTLQDSCY